MQVEKYWKLILRSAMAACSVPDRILKIIKIEGPKIPIPTDHTPHTYIYICTIGTICTMVRSSYIYHTHRISFVTQAARAVMSAIRYQVVRYQVVPGTCSTWWCLVGTSEYVFCLQPGVVNQSTTLLRSYFITLIFFLLHAMGVIRTDHLSLHLSNLNGEATTHIYTK